MQSFVHFVHLSCTPLTSPGGARHPLAASWSRSIGVTSRYIVMHACQAVPRRRNRRGESAALTRPPLGSGLPIIRTHGRPEDARRSARPGRARERRGDARAGGGPAAPNGGGQRARRGRRRALDRAARRARQAARPRAHRAPDRPGLAVPRAVARSRRSACTTTTRPARASSPASAGSSGTDVRHRRQRRDGQGRHVLPDDRQEAPARPGDRARRTGCRASTWSTRAARSCRSRTRSSPTATTSAASSTTRRA